MSSCWIFNFLLLPNCFSLSTRGQKGQSVTSQGHVILLLLWSIYIFMCEPQTSFSLSVFSHDRWMLALSLLDFFNFDASWFSYIYETAILHLFTMSIVVYDQHMQYVFIYHISSLRDEPIWTKLCRNIITSIWTSTCLKKQNKSNSPVVGIEIYMFISSSSCQNEFSNFTVTTVWMHDGMLSIFTVYGNIF